MLGPSCPKCGKPLKIHETKVAAGYPVYYQCWCSCSREVYEYSQKEMRLEKVLCILNSGTEAQKQRVLETLNN